MAGALRKAGEAVAKLRRLGAAVFERSEFCRSSRSAAVLAVKLFSAPLGLLVLFGLRKEQTPRYGSMFRIHATVAGRRVFSIFLMRLLCGRAVREGNREFFP